MSEDSIEREITIAAPIDKVWSVLTEPDHVGMWFGTGSSVRIDLRPGGVMELDHGTHGAYLDDHRGRRSTECVLVSVGERISRGSCDGRQFDARRVHVEGDARGHPASRCGERIRIDRDSAGAPSGCGLRESLARLERRHREDRPLHRRLRCRTAAAPA